MAIRKTIQVGDPRLKALNKTVEDFKEPALKQVVQDLIETMRATECIGMAAPQIGENWKVFVTEPRKTKFRIADQVDKLRVYVNPKIVETSKEQVVIWEGCGSFVHGELFGPVKRPKEIMIEAQDLKGKRFRLVCDGILARVIQHEYDHLDGIEFIEKVTDLRELKNADFYIKDIKGSKKQVEASIITKKVAQSV